MTCASLAGRGDSGSLRQKADKNKKNRVYVINLSHSCVAKITACQDKETKKQKGLFVPLMVHSAHIFQGHHGDICNKKKQLQVSDVFIMFGYF